MSKLLRALRRAFDTPSAEPVVHFHATSSTYHPEVCYETTCRRPRLSTY